MSAHTGFGNENLLGSSNYCAKNPSRYLRILAGSKGNHRGSLRPTILFVTDKLVGKQVFVPKHIIISQTLGRPQLVPQTEVTILESKPDTVAAVHYRPSVDRDTQISPEKTVEQQDDEKLKND